MDNVVLTEIPFKVDLDRLAEMVHARPRMLDELCGLAAEAENIARPKAVFRVIYVDERGPDHVVLDGLRFTSRVLSVNLEQAHRVFVYVATAGRELDAWATGQSDMMRSFCADAINELGVHSALSYLSDHLERRYQLGQVGRMNPGSLTDWPITQQRPLFALMGDTEAAIGVCLTQSLLMTPTKSVSGIIFPTESTFASCQLCPRQECPNRRAPYDEGLWRRKYESTNA